MKNIIWDTGSGVAITSLAEAVESRDHAAELRSRGDVPPEWSAVEFDISLTADQSAAIGALRWVNGALIVDDGVRRARDWAAHRSAAQAQLDASDITVLRCVERGVGVPAEWATYRGALRAIVRATSGDPTQPLPPRPAYPANT